MKKFKGLTCGLVLVGCLLSGQAYAAATDDRFVVELSVQPDVNLDIQVATKLALPTLWKRILLIDTLDEAAHLPVATSLVLQFKWLKHSAKVVFNPVQVKRFLSRRGITMIPEQPDWNLSVFALGFSDVDESVSEDLLNHAYGIADEYGFRLSSRGKKMQLIFAPTTDVYGEAMIHIDMQGAFSPDLLKETDIPSQGLVSYQLQDLMRDVLWHIRDAYALGTIHFDNTSSEILLTIESEYPLASQVMLEQALAKQQEVVSIVPVLLQKERRQYRLQLLNGDDAWLTSWFAAYGFRASKQPEGSLEDWLVQ